MLELEGASTNFGAAAPRLLVVRWVAFQATGALGSPGRWALGGLAAADAGDRRTGRTSRCEGDAKRDRLDAQTGVRSLRNSRGLTRGGGDSKL